MMALVWVVGIWAITMVTIKLLKDWFGGNKEKNKIDK
jgi:hypothetical protein